LHLPNSAHKFHSHTTSQQQHSRASLSDRRRLSIVPPSIPPMAVHYTSGPAFWLVLYFFFNLSLTLYNKSVLIRFPFPYTLTALHALCSATGSYIAKNRGYFTPANVSPRQNVMLIAFSVLYTINIAVSNQSLQMVTIPFHQVVRSTTPFFTLVLSVVILRARFSSEKFISLVPIVGGVALATYGDYSFTTAGLLLTLLGTVLAALKTISTNFLQSAAPPQQKGSLASSLPVDNGSSGFRLTAKLHPLDLLIRMSPLAFIQCVFYAHLTGELDRVRHFSSTHMTKPRLLALAVNGMIAFGLNVVSFTANKKYGALTMTVAANVKQVLTILLAVMIFNLSLTPFNASGIALTILGGAWYGFIDYKEKNKRSHNPLSADTPPPPIWSEGSDYLSPNNHLNISTWSKRLRSGLTALPGAYVVLQAVGLSQPSVMTKLKMDDGPGTSSQKR